ncbi:MAG: hypothetical protein RBQ97_09815 [Acholeplasma sp.]|nr:hypothetical protein [Acholeplasma sp.]
MKRKTKRTMTNIILAVVLLFGVSYASKLLSDKETEIEGTKLSLTSIDSYTFPTVNKVITFYHDDYDSMIWGFNYNGQPTYETLDFLSVVKGRNYISLTLKNVYYVPLELVASDLGGTYSKVVELNVITVEGITLDETEVSL